MSENQLSPLQILEPRLRSLLPADLYVSAWINPNPRTLMRVFDHLRTLHRILTDYVPKQVSAKVRIPGQVDYHWEQGTLMFTDLAGFTPLLEANSIYGPAGAKNLLAILNQYFSMLIEIVSKSGGHLLEFTGDAILAQFPASDYQNDTEQAVNAGLRMQRAMAQFDEIQTPNGTMSLGMRIGLHTGRFLIAQVGTPRRMEQVLLGTAIRETKLAEGAGRVGQVNLTSDAFEHVIGKFTTEPGDDGYTLVIDDLSEAELGEYELTAFNSRRLPSALVLDRSVEGITQSISEILARVEPLASYLPPPVLNFVVESAAKRQIPPAFPKLSVIFINLIGLSENIDSIPEDAQTSLIETFTHAFALINAVTEAQGGVLKHVTYHLAGADILIYFGMPNAHSDDPVRAARAATTIRDLVAQIALPEELGDHLATRIGISHGEVFAAEIGDMRGRREWNILGDTVNTAARLMGKAGPNQIFVTESIYHNIWNNFDCEALPERLKLKGKSRQLPVFSLIGEFDDE